MTNAYQDPTATTLPSNATKLRKKLVIVGDGECGKTSLLMVQSGLPFPEDYQPTIFENYVSRIEVGSKLVELSLWDTAGQVIAFEHLDFIYTLLGGL